MRLPALLAFFVLLAGSACAQPQHGDAGMPEFLTIGEAMEEAAASDKLVLVSVHADWCGWCKKLDQEVYADPEVQAYLAEHFALARIRSEDGEVQFKGEAIDAGELIEALGARGTPNTAFFTADGEYLSLLPGFRPREEFLLALRYLGDGAYENETYEEFVERVAPAEPAGAEG